MRDRPRGSSQSQGACPQTANGTYPAEAAAGPGRSKHWKRSHLSLAHSAKSRNLPRASLRAQDRPRGAQEQPANTTNTSQSQGACPQTANGTYPAEAAAGPGRSKHWKRSHLSLAHSAKAATSSELPCERRTGPAEPRTQPATRTIKTPQSGIQ
jgi:hypothetical protein